MNTERYQRQLVLPDFGAEGQKKLLEASVLVIGAGGLGVPVLQYLVGMGVGTVGMMDGDAVSLSNLQRQVLYTTADVGKKKVEVARERLELLNPEVEIKSIDGMLSEANAEVTINEYDVVVDCTDSIEARYVINDACMRLSVPFVYGALYRHEGHVSVFNYQGGVTYRDVYPNENVRVDNCNEIGVLGVLPGLTGCYQAMEVIKILTGVGELLAGKLLVVDAMHSEHHVFQLGERPRTEKKTTLKNSEVTEQLITWQELDALTANNYHFLDVREGADYERSHDKRFENVPLSMLAGFSPENSKEVVLVCHQGRMTRQASAIIQAGFPETVIHQVKGGYARKNSAVIID